MHNIDRTQREGEMGYEMGNEFHELSQELNQGFGNELGYETGNELNELGQELGQEFGYEFSNEYQEVDGEMYEAEIMSEIEEMELAAELLEIQSEEELEQFIGGLLKKAFRGARSVFRSPVFKVLGRTLKAVAKKALPIVGKVAGSYFGPIGGMVGGKLGSLASNLFEMEMEGLSQEDREFEIARRFVRFADAAIRNAARAPRGEAPQAIARTAFTSAAKRFAPGLLRLVNCSSGCSRRHYRPAPLPQPQNRGRGIDHSLPSTTTTSVDTNFPGRSGRWYRRGRNIILAGI